MATLTDAASPTAVNKYGRGRPHGSKNKTTETMRWGFVEAYRQLGGVDGLVRWGRRNPDAFYPMLKALLPHELAEAGHASGITIVIQGRTPNIKPLDVSQVTDVHAQVVDVVDGHTPHEGV